MIMFRVQALKSATTGWRIQPFCALREVISQSVGSKEF